MRFIKVRISKGSFVTMKNYLWEIVVKNVGCKCNDLVGFLFSYNEEKTDEKLYCPKIRVRK